MANRNGTTAILVALAMIVFAISNWPKDLSQTMSVSFEMELPVCDGPIENPICDEVDVPAERDIPLAWDSCMRDLCLAGHEFCCAKQFDQSCSNAARAYC